MVSRENITREALSDLEAQRAQNLMEEKRRKAEAAEKSSAVAELLAKRQRLFSAGIRSAFAAPKDAQSISSRMQQEIEAINLSLREELSRAGFPGDYLQPVVRCALCRDTGYVGEPIKEQCVCLKRAVMNKLYQNEGLQGLERENFTVFDENIFPDELKFLQILTVNPFGTP